MPSVEPGQWRHSGVALVILPAAERPSRFSLGRLTHEFGLKDELDEAWAFYSIGRNGS